MEIWKPVVDWEDKYECSSLGRIRSLNYNKTGKVKILTPHLTKNGYLRITFSRNNKPKYYYVHDIIAKAFIPNPRGLPFINHINEIKTDNRVENLEWCDQSYNNSYGVRSKKQALTRSIKVYQYTLSGKFVKDWVSGAEAARALGINKGGISSCCRGKCSFYKKFIWSYEKPRV